MMADFDTCGVVYGPDVNGSKPVMDDKTYRVITLVQNGLECVLVSDMHAQSQDEDSSDDESDSEDDHPHHHHHHEQDHEDDEEDAEGNDEEGDQVDGSEDNGSSGSEGEEEEEDDDDDEDRGAKKRRAAVCVAVGVGSFEDPTECEGLAHFLEHMCFMGSEKYPGENDFDSFINKNGGDSNAYTEGEHTCFYFNVKPGALAQALDIFAQFFVSPLLKEDAVDRELNAIESEFQLAKRSESNRMQEVCCRTSRPGHPLAKFGWGNMKSLREDPELNNVDPLAMLRKLYDNHYVSGNMKLCICAPLPLDELERIVLETCQCIRSRPDAKKEDQSWTYEPIDLKDKGLPFQGFENEEEKQVMTQEMIVEQRLSLGAVFYIVPRMDLHKIRITWQLPPQYMHYKCKPSDYVSHLLGHESEGSVFAVARSRGWATSLLAGGSEGYEENTCCTQLPVTLSLTRKGICEWKSIVGLVLEYIAMLRAIGPPKYFFDELAAISEMEYRFIEDEDPEELVQSLAVRLLPQSGYKKEDLLTGPHLLPEWDPEKIIHVLSHFGSNNFRVDLCSSVFGRDRDFTEEEEGEDGDMEMEEVNDDGEEKMKKQQQEEEVEFPNNPAHRPDTKPLVESHFKTRYWVDRIDKETLKDWQNIFEETYEDCLKQKESNEMVTTKFSKLHLPPPNRYIAKDFDLKPFPEEEALHPLVGAYIKIQVPIGNSKRQEWIYGFVLNFNAKTQEIETEMEDDADERFRFFRLWDEETDQPPEPPSSQNGVGNGNDVITLIHKGKKGKTKQLKAIIVAGGVSNKSPQQLNAAANRLFRLRENLDEEDAIRVSSGRMPKLSPVYEPKISKFSTKKFRLWCLHDRIIQRPKMDVILNIVTTGENMVHMSPRHVVGTDLYLRMVIDSLTDESYLASMAELQYGLMKSENGIRIKFSGYNDKLFKLIDVVLLHLLEDGIKVTEQNRRRLQVQRESLTRVYSNSGCKSHRLCTSLRLQCLQRHTWGSEEMHEQMNQCFTTLEELGDFVRNELFGNGYVIDGLIGGNIVDEVDGKQLHDLVLNKHFKNRFQAKKSSSDRPKLFVSKLNAGDKYLVERFGREPKDKNSSVEIYFQIGPDNLRDRAILSIIEHCMEEPIYDTLRTKQQLGYSVHCGWRNTDRVLGFAICITSATHTTYQLESHTFKFLEDFVTTLKESNFEESIQTLVEYKLEDDNNLYERVKRYWNAIASQTLLWNECRHEAFTLFSISKKDVMEKYNEWFIDSDKAKLISIFVNGLASVEDQEKVLERKYKRIEKGMIRSTFHQATKNNHTSYYETGTANKK